MRRFPLISALAILAVPAVVALSGGTALAAATPAPDCESFSSQFLCDAFVPVGTVTWTQTIRIDGFTSTSTFSGPATLRGNCELRANYSFSFSYVSGGVTFTSDTSTFLCTANKPE